MNDLYFPFLLKDSNSASGSDFSGLGQQSRPAHNLLSFRGKTDLIIVLWEEARGERLSVSHKDDRT
jgi:hypothetical protein